MTTTRNDQPEHRLQHWCIELLDRIMLTDGPHHWTAIDHSVKMTSATPQAKMNFENHRKFMGIKPHHLDVYIYQYPLFTQIELKFAATEAAANRAVTQGQRDTMTVLNRQKVPSGLAWSIRSFYSAIRCVGFRLHGNAENIVTEIEARYQAAQQGAEIKRGSWKPSNKRRVDKPSATQIARSVALQARVAH